MILDTYKSKPSRRRPLELTLIPGMTKADDVIRIQLLRKLVHSWVRDRMTMMEVMNEA